MPFYPVRAFECAVPEGKRKFTIVCADTSLPHAVLMTYVPRGDSHYRPFEQPCIPSAERIEAGNLASANGTRWKPGPESSNLTSR